MTKAFIKIDGKTDVRFDYENCSFELCSREISRLNDEIHKMEQIAHGQVIPVVVEEHKEGYVDVRFSNDSLSPADVQNIQDYIQSIMRASAMNRIIEAKAGIVVAKSRIKQII